MKLEELREFIQNKFKRDPYDDFDLRDLEDTLWEIICAITDVVEKQDKQIKDLEQRLNKIEENQRSSFVGFSDRYGFPR